MMQPIDFEIDDLPEQLQHIADVIGLHLTKKMMMEFSGAMIKFPVHWPPGVIKRFISLNYNGKNANELAARLGMSRQTIFNYLNEKISCPSVQNVTIQKPGN